MSNWFAQSVVVFLGLSGGVAVGSGLVALLVVFDLIPRLAQLSRAYHYSGWFESAVIAGAVYWSFAEFLNWQMTLPAALTLPFMGLLDGMFVGMLAAALTEVINVLPILARRLRLSGYILSLLMAMVLGKVAGSLFDWLYYHWY